MTKKTIPSPQELFEQFYPINFGVDFKLLSYCSQVVNGVNYALEISKTLVTKSPSKPTTIYHYFYVDTEGNVTDNGLKDHMVIETGNAGGWSCHTT